jgi:hypothetical protein
MAASGKPFWKTLYFQVLAGIALGVLVGWLFPEFGAALKPLGDAFIKLVKMIITPVIFLTVVTGIAGMSDLKAFGRVGAKAMAYFLTFSTRCRFSWRSWSAPAARSRSSASSCRPATASDSDACQIEGKSEVP